MWISYYDMHSGGSRKLDWEVIFIEADSEEEANNLFVSLFGRHPDNVTCDYCGNDYSVDECETLEQATAFYRGCAWDKQNKLYIEEPSSRPWSKQYQTLEEYKKSELVHFVPKEDKQ